MGTLLCNAFFVHLFLFLLLNVTHLFTSVQTLCHVDEGSALLQFKESFTVRHKSAHPKFTSWTAQEGQMNLSCCSWSGVKCDEYSGYVIGLDLRSSYLYGSINSSSSLFRLVHLQRLDLSDNDFSHSEIPLRLGHDLTSLTYLNLSHCSFHGEFPVGIFHLPNLQVLDLDSNEDLKGYFPDFNKSNALKYLNVAGTIFSGHLPASIGNLRSLKFLSIEYCEFFPHLPSSVGNLTQLSYLDISFFFDRSFTHSYVSPVNFSLIDTDSWSWVGKLAKLYHLGLGHTYLTGEFPSFVANLTQLAELSLDYNKLTGQIPLWLMKFTQLTFLNLQFNNFQGEIPSSLFQLENLEYLDLYSNNLSGSVDFDTISNLKKLRVLQLSLNKLSLKIKSGLMATAPKFEVLKLGSCNLTEFPEFLKNNSGLVELDLSDNYIHGQIPEWMWNSTRETLLYLNLSRNSLTGFDQNPVVLPWWNLLSFELGFNSNQGSLPSPPPTIQIYSVPNNGYSGEISLSFCNLSSVYILDLSNNNLRGHLPQCLGNFDAMVILNLQNNHFHGEIPPMCTKGISLKSVDLSDNLLDGKLPTSMANCTRLEFLNLAKNQISDILPAWLWSLPDLRVLSLRSNRFHGIIGKPATNIESSKLCTVDLSNNAFSGMLPSNYMENWNCLKFDAGLEDPYFHDTYRVGSVTFRYGSLVTISSKGMSLTFNPLRYGPYLKVIDFSSNKFGGKIPGTIGNFLGLHLLNLSNNILTGNIPSSLGYLPVLEVLDLSRNQLSGEIPSSLAQIDFLAWFDVSHNHLRGPIPYGRQLTTFANSSYEGNSGLCGPPLSKKCEVPETYSSFKDDQDSWFQFVPAGLVSGLVVGFVAGNALTTYKHEWFVEKFSRRKHPRHKRGKRGHRN